MVSRKKDKILIPRASGRNSAYEAEHSWFESKAGCQHAVVMELVDITDLKSVALVREGSSPSCGTNNY